MCDRPIFRRFGPGNGMVFYAAPAPFYPPCPPTAAPPSPVYYSPAPPMGVTPSPIDPSDGTLRGMQLLSDLRARALQICLGGQPFSSILPEVHRRLGDSSTVNPAEIGLQAFHTPDGIEQAMSGIRTHVPLANGTVGEFNQVVTFSLPAAAANLSLRAYYFDRPEVPSSGWNSNSSFTPGNTHSQRFHNLYEVHVRRVGDRYVYTVALTHGFVGGLRIGTGSGNLLLISHGAQPSPPAEDHPAVQVETPNENLIVRSLPLPDLPDAGSAAPPPTLAASAAEAGSGQPSVPVNSTAFQPETGGAQPNISNSTLNVAAADAPDLPPLPMVVSDTPPHLPAGSSVGSSDRDTPGPGPDALAGGATPLLSNTRPEVLAGNTDLPPLPDASADAARPPLTSDIGSSSPLPPLVAGDGLFAGFVQPRAGAIPPIHPLGPSAGGPPLVTTLLPPLTAPLADDRLPPLAGSGSGGRTTAPTLISTLPGGGFGLGGAHPVVVRPHYNAPTFTLARYIPPEVDRTDQNRLRAQAYAILGLFTISPMHDMTGGGGLPGTDAASAFRDNVLDACYYFPETAFSSVTRLLNPQRPEDENTFDTLGTLIDSVLGTGETLPPRGTSLSVGSRVSAMSAFLSDNTALNGATQRNLREVRSRLLLMIRPLRWTALYVDGRQMDDAGTNGEEVRTALSPSIRPTAHHPFTITVQRTFQSIFSASPITTRHNWSQVMNALRNLDGMQIESVYDLGPQDVIALRALITRARTARQDPAFAANFSTSREAAVTAQLTSVLRPGTGGTVNEAQVQRVLDSLFGGAATIPNRAEMLRLVRTLNGDNTTERRQAVAAAILRPYAAELRFGEPQLRQLDTALDRLEAYSTRIQLLLRAQSVSDDTNAAVGDFLALLPTMRGSPATADPTHEQFETKLSHALDALESEYALLAGDAIGGTYAATRREILTFMLQDLRRELLNPDGPWSAFLTGTPARTALRTRLNRATPAPRTATPLPPDPIAQAEAVAEFLQSAYIQMRTSEAARDFMRLFSH